MDKLIKDRLRIVGIEEIRIVKKEYFPCTICGTKNIELFNIETDCGDACFDYSLGFCKKCIDDVFSGKIKQI